MDEILPRLYIGNYRDSKDEYQLANNSITHILAVHDIAKGKHPCPCQFIKCKFLYAMDTTNQNLSSHFSMCNDFIHEARICGGNVLVHCVAGVSRSVTITIAYIMSITNFGYKDALKVVRSKRRMACPNAGFSKQLLLFERHKLAPERIRMKEKFPSLRENTWDIKFLQSLLTNYDLAIENHEISRFSYPLGDYCSDSIGHGQRTLVQKEFEISSSHKDVTVKEEKEEDPPSAPRSATNEKKFSEQRNPLPSRKLGYSLSAPPSPRRNVLFRQLVNRAVNSLKKQN